MLTAYLILFNATYFPKNISFWSNVWSVPGSWLWLAGKRSRGSVCGGWIDRRPAGPAARSPRKPPDLDSTPAPDPRGTLDPRKCCTLKSVWRAITHIKPRIRRKEEKKGEKNKGELFHPPSPHHSASALCAIPALCQKACMQWKCSSWEERGVEDE